MAVKEFKFKLGNVKTRKLSLLHDSDDNSLQVLVDGKVADRDEKGTRYLIEDDAGNEIKFESGLDEKWSPWLKADGDDVKLALPLAWYQWAWIGLPVILVFAGGLIGGMIGGATTYLNMLVMQSNRPAVLRYGVTLVLSSSAVVLYALLAVLLNVTLGTSQGKSFVDAFKQGYAGVSESMGAGPSKPENIPNVYVDNGSGSVLEFSVDGKAQGELEPFGYKPMNLKPGRHKFTFAENKKDFDTVEVEIEKNKACVVNPNALSIYVVEKASFSSFNLVVGGGTGYETVKGRKSVSADYGFAEGIPEKIEVKMKGREMGQLTYRTKLLRSLPENLSSLESYTLLKNDADTLNVFYYTDKDSFISTLLAALGKEPRKPEYRDLLLDYASKSEKYVLNTALKSLKAYEEQIPDEKLAGFVMADEKVISSGMPYDSPAIDGRSGWAMKILLKRGKPDSLVKDFAKLHPNKKGLLLKYVMMEGDDTVKKSLVDAVFSSETIQDEFMLSSLLTIVASKDFSPDEGQMEKVDAYIPKIQLERARKHWEETWNSKVMSLAEGGAKNQYLQKKLVELLKNEGRDSKVVMIMVKNGDYKTVGELFAGLKGYEKLDVLRLLPSAKDVKVPEEAFNIAWMILDEKDDNLWRYGLHYLSANSPSAVDFLRKAWSYSAKIPDEKRRTSFNRELMSTSYSKLNEMELKDLCAVAAEAPTEDFVKQAVEKLEREDGKRAVNFGALAKSYLSAGDVNRAMIMRQMKNVSYIKFAFRKPDEFNVIRELLQLGLSDRNAAARIGALEAALRMDSTEFPSEDEAAKIIASTSPEQGRSSLKKEYERWICEAWRSKTNDRNSRAKALQKIAAVLEGTEDKEIAKFANSSLSNPDEAEKPYIEALLRIADKNKLPDAREDCLRRVAGLDVQKNPAVLAQLMKSLDDPDLKVRYQAFCLLAPKSRDFKDGKIIAMLKAAAAKEADLKTKADMERTLKSYLPATPRPNPPARR
ncbi:MAG TPA: hypothetical protein DET40_12130 [Lentisphaeria bacterium]|nr:MAG: hypothetical protein A2X45_07680 [Lentisphaerae bacterium GWF2_50_93]HCE44288.1 hypothetical protein [Lentisphaeria bacterium]